MIPAQVQEETVSFRLQAGVCSQLSPHRDSQNSVFLLLFLILHCGTAWAERAYSGHLLSTHGGNKDLEGGREAAAPGLVCPHGWIPLACC